MINSRFRKEQVLRFPNGDLWQVVRISRCATTVRGISRANRGKTLEICNQSEVEILDRKEAKKMAKKNDEAKKTTRYTVTLAEQDYPVSTILHILGHRLAKDENGTAIAKQVIASHDAMPTMGTFYWQLKLGRVREVEIKSLPKECSTQLGKEITAARKKVKAAQKKKEKPVEKPKATTAKKATKKAA